MDTPTPEAGYVIRNQLTLVSQSLREVKILRQQSKEEDLSGRKILKQLLKS